MLVGIQSVWQHQHVWGCSGQTTPRMQHAVTNAPASSPAASGAAAHPHDSHDSLNTVGGMAVQLPELDQVPLVQLAKGLPVKPPSHVVLQVAPEAVGREQAHAAPLVTLGLGWLVQSADSRAEDVSSQARAHCQ